jgi:hypothetical protein
MKRNKDFLLEDSEDDKDFHGKIDFLSDEMFLINDDAEEFDYLNFRFTPLIEIS